MQLRLESPRIWTTRFVFLLCVIGGFFAVEVACYFGYCYVNYTVIKCSKCKNFMQNNCWGGGAEYLHPQNWEVYILNILWKYFKATYKIIFNYLFISNYECDMHKSDWLYFRVSKYLTLMWMLKSVIPPSPQKKRRGRVPLFRFYILDKLNQDFFFFFIDPRFSMIKIINAFEVNI